MAAPGLEITGKQAFDGSRKKALSNVIVVV
jgi:hypothetical protein